MKTSPSQPRQSVRSQGSSIRPSVCVVSHQAYSTISRRSRGLIGGVEWQTSLTARWLAARGHAVTMLTWDEGGPAEETFDGVRVLKICRRGGGLPWLRFFHPKWTGLLRSLSLADADIYYQNGGECVTGQMVMWCRRNRRTSVFVAANDTDCDPALPELRSMRARWLYRYGLYRASARVVQTETQRRLLQEHFRLDADVIPMPCPGASREEFAARAYQGNGRVLWIARLVRQKRPDRLLDLAAACPEFQIDLVGPTYTDAYSQNVIRRAQTLPNVTVHGAVPRERLAAFYGQAAVMCCTSDYEGFPNTFLEGWSHGLPIVSTFDPDGLIRRRGLGVVAISVEGLAAGLHTCMSEPDTYRSMSREARRYYEENHALDVVMPRMQSVIVGSTRRSEAHGAT